MLDYSLLAAMATVIETGSFERAADRLAVTASAISQRVKLLEERMGTLLIIRAQPCRATPAGARLRQHFDEVALLEAQTASELGQSTATDRFAPIRVAVNADSLASWFPQALSAARAAVYDVIVDDEAHTLDRLRNGDVVAAVSAMPGPIQGCDSCSLGIMRYVPSASPAFYREWFGNGISADALKYAPCIAYDVRDSFHAKWIAAVTGKRLPLPPTHHVASPEAIVNLTLAGLGWALNSEPAVADHLAEGRLVSLGGSGAPQVDLYWHWSRVVAGPLASLTAAVRMAATKQLAKAAS